MSRKSVLLAVGILALLVIGTAVVLFVLVRHEPAFYRRVALPAGAARKKQAVEFVQQATGLRSAISRDREWSAHFSEEQINSFFMEGFPHIGLDEKPLPDDINDPRIQIEGDRLRLGFRYGRGLWSTIVTIDFRVWVAKNEPNVVGLELQGMHAGSLPINAQSLLEHVSDAARRLNVEVTWYRYDGNPTALLRFQNKRSRASVQLQQIELYPGKLVIQGCSVDSTPARATMSASAP